MSIPGWLKSLLVSRKFWLMIIGVIVGVVLFARGAITAEQLADMVVALVAVVIGSIAYEDGAAKSNRGSQTNLVTAGDSEVTVNQPVAAEKDGE